MKKFLTALLLTTAVLTLNGCATKPTDPDELAIYEQNNDPMEPMNRTTHAFNAFVWDYILFPVSRGYRAVVPEPVRAGVYNFFANVKQPVYLMNAVFQGNWADAGNISKRFTANTFLGFLGFIDVAGHMKIGNPENDFGQTLGTWGVPEGPYFVIPILGPSSVRDTAGEAVDAVADPLGWATWSAPWVFTYSRFTAEGVEEYDHKIDMLNNIRRGSTDEYATLRTMYKQLRAQKVGGKETDAPKDYEFSFDIEEEDE